MASMSEALVRANNRYKDRQRSQGRRTFQTWVYDTKRVETINECKEQILRIAGDKEHEEKIMAELWDVADMTDWE